MRLLPDRARFGRSGFTLLEAMLAFAVLGILLTGLYAMVFSSFARQLAAEQEYQRTSLASALLDEYIITYPSMQTKGIYKSTWAWQITEEPTDPVRPTELDHLFAFFEVTATVQKVGSDNTPITTMSTVVARRGQVE